jgi:hypothetical protein
LIDENNCFEIEKLICDQMKASAEMQKLNVEHKQTIQQVHSKQTTNHTKQKQYIWMEYFN